MEIEDIYPPNQTDYEKRERFMSLSRDEQERLINLDMKRALLENQKDFKTLAIENSDDPEKRNLYERVHEISQRVSEAGGIALVVGGFARDSILKSIGYDLDPKDVDLEIYGLEMPILESIISQFGNINMTGRSFVVLKLGDIDISIPREDSKVADGHTGFIIKGDPYMSGRDAAKRRDLTINSVALNPLTGEILDPFGGIDDILNKQLRATDFDKFKEDPLRVLRVMQFAGRFGFKVEEETKKICIELVRSGALGELSVERFEEEWKKLLLKSKKPSVGLEVARELEIVNIYPELKALIGCKQEYEWHPEGDVWTHTLMVVDEASKIASREKLNNEQSLVLMLSALCHDFGKPSTTTIKEIKGVQRITAYSHEEAGVEPAKKFLKSINIPAGIIEKILPLVYNHLFPTIYNNVSVSDAAIRRLAKKLQPASIGDLVMLGEADVHGRGYWKDQPNAIEGAREWQGYLSGEMLISHAERLPDISGAKVVRYMTGKKLIDLGLDPKAGKKIGEIIAELDRAQEEGKITGEGDTKLARLMVFLNKAEKNEPVIETLLTGDILTRDQMIREVKDRFFEIGTHDMGTLVMTLILQGKKLPNILEQNKSAILTAHKHGPAWFKHFDRTFYETSWKSFYGQFEVDIQKQKELGILDFEEQLKLGLDLIENPDQVSIQKYKESFDIEPIRHSGRFAFYVTDLYPFETGMISGFEVMVQYIPQKRRVCISVMNEDPTKVSEIDGKIRDSLPEFKNAKKVGYLFASNEQEEDNIFNEEDGLRVYKNLLSLFDKN